MLAALAGLVLALMLLAGLGLTALLLLAGFVLLLLAGFVLTTLLRVILLLLWVALWILLFIGHFEALRCLGLLGGVSPAQSTNARDGCRFPGQPATTWNHGKNTNGENPERGVVAPECPC